MTKTAIVIGSGFAGLSAATCLAHKGFKVTLLEKNSSPGGRARKFEAEGFVFDMGPSWYWMPDVFENYFALFGKKVSDYYTLTRLDPSYDVYFDDGKKTPIPADLGEFFNLFEKLEPGSSANLQKFLDEAAYKYEVGINRLVHKPSRSLLEFADLGLLYGLVKMDVFNSMSKYIRKLFKHPYLIQLLEFPVLFLGAMPNKIPALYSLMNFADIKLGTWYPQGGMHEIVKAMVSLAEEKGVEIKCNEEVLKMNASNGQINSIETKKGTYEADFIVAGADYHHIEQEILPEEYRNYSASYWDKRIMAPSSLLFYIGVDKKIEGLSHHTLFFDSNFEQHAKEIYENPQWPSNPLFYVCCPSKTDMSVAPEGMENLFILIPTAPDLEDKEEIRMVFFDSVIERLEKLIHQQFKQNIVYMRSYAHKDFKADYHAFKGNAYGLANTLMQTAILKPSLKSKKLKNLYFTGQLTVPGPGVPPSLISGQVVANEIVKSMHL